MHGFGTDHTSETVLWIIAAYLKNSECNLFTLDWAKAAAFPDYPSAVRNVEKVICVFFFTALNEYHVLIFHFQIGSVIAGILLRAYETFVFILKKLQLIGHSLGAQMCGTIGRCFTQQSSNRTKLPL